jgi:hypothetical protein
MNIKVVLPFISLLMIRFVSTSNAQSYDPPRENLKLAVADTIRISKPYYFTNSDSADSFLLIMNPGLVKNSRSMFEIRSHDNKLLYSYPFDTFWLIAHIFDPDSISRGGQKVYEAYLDQYWKSLTQKQYENYLNMSVKNFFNDNFNFVEKSEISNLSGWSNVPLDHSDLREVIANPNVKLLFIRCFDCDGGGGSVIFFSPSKKKMIQLFTGD